MKIAIQGHPTRGKEVIKILESLGGKNVETLTGTYKSFYYIDDENEITDDHKENFPPTYKLYTLEEFEKEFPFKIGDKVIHKEFNDFFEVISFDPESSYPYKIKGVCEFNTKSHVLTKWQPKMKEERFVTLTLDKAKEWYNKGGELREIALQAFTRAELNPLPKSWEEFCKQGNLIASWRYHIPTKYEALFKLEHLRDCYRGLFVTVIGMPVWCIKRWKGELIIGKRVWGTNETFLSFQSLKVAEEYLNNFKPLIKQAEDLI